MKKKNFLSILLAIASIFTTSAQIKVEVSETVELMSILSRAAGFEEYCMDQGGQYTTDTEAWFASFKQHDIISYYQRLREQYAIGYDAVASMAIHLEIEDGTVRFIGQQKDLENRWKKVAIDTFLLKLNRFYVDTRFHDFFEQHRAFYNDELKKFEANVMCHFRQDWYAQFHGTAAKERFRVIIGFTNGRCNYGPDRHLPDLPREAFSILGYQVTGKPLADDADLMQASTLIHEFNHSFVNPLLDESVNIALMKNVGEKLFQLSHYDMGRHAYVNWKTIINESIVRAAGIIYLHDNGFSPEQIQSQMYREVWFYDFRWIPELAACLRIYANNRDNYPTLNDYYPEIAKCLEKYIENETSRMTDAQK